jgi:hypothetical protein
MDIALTAQRVIQNPQGRRAKKVKNREGKKR